jgi:hypothetical protein
MIHMIDKLFLLIDDFILIDLHLISSLTNSSYINLLTKFKLIQEYVCRNILLYTSIQ